MLRAASSSQKKGSPSEYIRKCLSGLTWIGLDTSSALAVWAEASEIMRANKQTVGATPDVGRPRSIMGHILRSSLLAEMHGGLRRPWSAGVRRSSSHGIVDSAA